MSKILLVGFVRFSLPVLSVIGCGISKPPLFLALETEHFEIYREEGLPAACEATGTEFEGYLRTFEDYLEVQLPTGRRIIYNQFSNYAHIAELCGVDRGDVASGCYIAESDMIASVYSIHPHEIAHVLERRIGGPGRHPRFFEEGIASMLGGGNSSDRSDHRVDSSPRVEDLVDDQAFKAQYDMPLTAGGGSAVYTVAAGFVRYLIDTYGKDAFLRFYVSVTGVTDGATVKERLSLVSGAPFDDVVKTWRDSVQPLVDDLAPTAPGCDQSAESGNSGATRVDPACESARITFDVPPTGRLDLLLTGGADAPAVRLWSCQRGAVNPERDISVNGPMRLALDLPSGRYEMIVRGAPVDVAIAPVPVTIDLDGTCDSAHVPAIIASDQSAEFALIRRWGNVEKSVAFDVVSQSVGRIDVTSVGGTFYPGTTPRRFYLCPDACVSDLDGQCRYDDEPRQLLPDGSIDNTHDVFGTPVGPGDLLHFATGSRYQQDWGYSVRLSLH